MGRKIDEKNPADLKIDDSIRDRIEYTDIYSGNKLSIWIDSTYIKIKNNN